MVWLSPRSVSAHFISSSHLPIVQKDLGSSCSTSDRASAFEGFPVQGAGAAGVGAGRAQEDPLRKSNEVGAP